MRADEMALPIGQVITPPVNFRSVLAKPVVDAAVYAKDRARDKIAYGLAALGQIVVDVRIME